MLILGILVIIVIISISQPNSLEILNSEENILNKPTQAIILSNNKIMINVLGSGNYLEDRKNIYVDQLNLNTDKNMDQLNTNNNVNYKIFNKFDFIKEYGKYDIQYQITSSLVLILLLIIMYNILIYTQISYILETSFSNLFFINYNYIGQGIGILNNLFIVNNYTIIFQSILFIAAFIIFMNFGYINYISEYNSLNLYNNATLSLIPMLSKKERNSLGVISLFDKNPYKSMKLIEFIKPSESLYIIGLFSILGGLLLINTNNLLVLFIAIEVQSYSLYTMGSLYKDSYTATDNGLKYFLLGGIASVFILLGCSILYATTGSFNIDDLILFIDTNNNNKLYGIISGSICIILGIFLKISSAPMHTWSLDVYDGVPTLVTTWYSVLTKISFLGFIGKYVNYIIYNVYSFNIINSTSISYIEIIYVIIICSMLSMLIGSISGLKESNIKRLLGLSGVTNIGYLLLSISSYSSENISMIGDSSLISSSSFIFYLIQYTISNINIFLIILIFGYMYYNPTNDHQFIGWKTTYDSYSPIRMINNLKGLFMSNSYLAIAFTISMFSLIGIPPLVGFYAKYFIIISSIYSQYYLLVIILIIASVITSFYYLRLIKLVFLPSNNSIINYNTLFNQESLVNNNNTINTNINKSEYLDSSLLTDNYYYNVINEYNIYNITNFLSNNILNNKGNSLSTFNNNVSTSHLSPYMIFIGINTSLLILLIIYYYPLISLFI